MPRRTLLGLLVIIVVLAAPTAVGAAPTAVGTGGAAATVDSIATTAATDALRQGGNAVDAAVAAAAVLGVTEPFSCGIGGGGFMVIRTPDGAVTTIDSREKAPAAMRPNSFFENGKALAFSDARYSGLSGGVPGTVEGWDRALRDYGTWSLGRALRSGIDVARNGFQIDQTFHDQAQSNAAFFDDIVSSEALYLDPDGSAHDVGQVQRNPDMARAYERIADLGAKGFYRGAIADALTEAVQNPPLTPDADHTWRPGLMTMRDLRDYTAPERRPTRVVLPRTRRLRHGPALLGRLDRRRGAQHHGGEPTGRDVRHGAAPLVPRGLALLVRRPQRVPGRSGVLRRAASPGCSRPRSPPSATP